VKALAAALIRGTGRLLKHLCGIHKVANYWLIQFGVKFVPAFRTS
jgi:hypothetical protein